MTVQHNTAEWYADYYKARGIDRNDLLRNPGVLFQHFAFDASIIRALRYTLLSKDARILDVGCGNGGGFPLLLRLGFFDLSGIDVLPERITAAKHLFQTAKLVCDDAACMPYPENSFDLVMESTMFVQITDDSAAKAIAKEMTRVTKPGGYVLLVDWRYGKPWNDSYKPLSQKRIASLFPLQRVSVTNGALVPPLGRAVSRLLPSMYFALAGLLPFLAGSQATLLKK